MKQTKGIIIAPGLENYLAINCLNKERAPFIAFIVSEQTIDLLPEILGGLEYKPREIRKFLIKDLVSSGEIVQEFINAFHWLTEVKKVKKISVDATNTLKTVGIPIYFIASFIEIFRDLIREKVEIKRIFTTCDWEVVEIDSHSTGRPIIGTEKLIQLDHPMNTVGFVLGAIANDLFNGGFFPRAKKVFKMLAKHTIGEQHLLYNGLFQLSHAYDFWDKFNINQAIKGLEKAKNRLAKVTGFAFVKDLIKEINVGIAALKRMSKGDQIEEMIDLFQNAERRLKQERFDDAVARYYRCLEMIAKYRLEKYQIDHRRPDFSKLSKEAIARLKKERGGILPTKYQAGTGGLMLKDSYAVLSYLNDPLGKKYQTNRSLFIGLLNMRNRSILAHDNQTIKEKGAEQFRDRLVKPFLQALAETEKFSLERIIDQHCFPELPNDIENLYQRS